MKTYRIESKVGSVSAILAEGCHESKVDYRFVCEGFIVAQFPKAMVRGVSEVPVASTEIEALLCPGAPDDRGMQMGKLAARAKI
jgi:hypothetical protein